jgi:hypothetical protein
LARLRRIERIRANNEISVGEFYRVMREMGRVVETFVRDSDSSASTTIRSMTCHKGAGFHSSLR